MKVQSITEPFEFFGNSREYFRIWSINTLLTVLTLGFYSPWAKVRKLRYFYGNTRLCGHTFDFQANPWNILCARLLVLIGLLALALLVPLISGNTSSSDLIYNAVVLALLPWALVRGIAFNARYSVYRAGHFRFNKRYAPAYRFLLAVITPFILIFYAYLWLDPSLLDAAFDWETLSFFFRLWLILSAALLLALWYQLPALVRNWHRFKISHYRLPPLSFGFETPPLADYRLALWGLPVATVSVVFAALFATWQAFGSVLGGIWVLLVFLAIYLPGHFLFSLIGAMLARAQWNAARFTDGTRHGRINANFSLGAFAYLQLTNLLAIFASLGLLYPWTRIRRARFFLSHLNAAFPPELRDALTAHEARGENALGVELDSAEGFDLDIGII